MSVPYCGKRLPKSTRLAHHLFQCFGLIEAKLTNRQTLKLVEGTTSSGERGFLCQCSLNNGACREVFSMKHNLIRHIESKGSSWLGEFKVSPLFYRSFRLF